jgi:hypothetical protein
MRMVRMEHWSGFFQTAASVTATLIGFLIVGISVNTKEIIAMPRLPGRAAEAIIPLVGSLVIEVVALIPMQRPALFGVEVLVMGVLVWLLCLLSQIMSIRRARAVGEPRGSGSLIILFHLLLNHLQSLPLMIAGALMILNMAASLYWIAAGVVLALIISSVNAWVLLIEILR